MYLRGINIACGVGYRWERLCLHRNTLDLGLVSVGCSASKGLTYSVLLELYLAASNRSGRMY